jgi:hypothetical protein
MIWQMVTSVLLGVVILQKTPTVTYEYQGKINGRPANLTLEWPKGSGHKMVEKLIGTLSGGNPQFFEIRGTNQAKGRMILDLLDNKKKRATLRLMRDPKKAGVWTGDYYLPKQKSVAVTFKSLGVVEIGC